MAGQAAFRHALAQEALYAEVPWIRRRDLHRQLAEPLEASDGASLEIATHWRGAGNDGPRPRGAWSRAARESEARPRPPRRGAGGAQGARALARGRGGGAAGGDAGALRALRRAGRRAGRSDESLARAGRLPATVGGDGLGYAEAQRRLAAVYDLGGEREQAFAARRLAAEAFAAADRPAEAALERLAMADHHRRGGALRRGDRAGRARGAGGAGGGAGRPRRPRPRPARRGRGQGRRVRARPGVGPHRPRAGARARPHPGRRRALPAPQPRPLRRRRLPPGRGGARHRPRPLPHRRRRRHRGRLRHLPRLRPPRARRVVARRPSWAAS